MRLNLTQLAGEGPSLSGRPCLEVEALRLSAKSLGVGEIGFQFLPLIACQQRIGQLPIQTLEIPSGFANLLLGHSPLAMEGLDGFAQCADFLPPGPHVGHSLLGLLVRMRDLGERSLRILYTVARVLLLLAQDIFRFDAPFHPAQLAANRRTAHPQSVLSQPETLVAHQPRQELRALRRPHP